MAFDALVLPLRAVQVVFSIIVLGLSAYGAPRPAYPSSASR